VKVVTGFLLGVADFFAEDGSIVVGAVIALVIVGGLAIWKPIGATGAFAGPLLFVLIAALLVANLLRVAHQSRPSPRR
jgi:hypothetical protein